MSRTPTKKVSKLAHQREDVRKVHPYHDVTAEWLRENDGALLSLQILQRELNAEIRKLQLGHAQEWLSVCKRGNAPEAVIKQAQANVKQCEGRLNG